MQHEDVMRARSFVERYVIERCRGFGPGQSELQDAHAAVLAAEQVYSMIQDRVRGATAGMGATQAPAETPLRTPWSNVRDWSNVNRKGQP